jgi:hypothetical protein
MSFGNNNNNNNKHDDIHNTDINQSNFHIGLGETIIPNPMHTVHSYVRLASNQKPEYLDTLTLA